MNLLTPLASAVGNSQPKSITKPGTVTQIPVIKKSIFTLGIPLRAAAETGPGELIAAAHAQSFTLSLSQELGLKVGAAGRIVTTASVTLEHLAAGWTIGKVHLRVVARIPGLTQGRFIDATVRAKTTCMVSRSLRANISMTAKLDK